MEGEGGRIKGRSSLKKGRQLGHKKGKWEVGSGEVAQERHTTCLSIIDPPSLELIARWHVRGTAGCDYKATRLLRFRIYSQ